PVRTRRSPVRGPTANPARGPTASPARGRAARCPLPLRAWSRTTRWRSTSPRCSPRTCTTTKVATTRCGSTVATTPRPRRSARLPNARPKTTWARVTTTGDRRGHGARARRDRARGGAAVGSRGRPRRRGERRRGRAARQARARGRARRLWPVRGVPPWRRAGVPARDAPRSRGIANPTHPRRDALARRARRWTRSTRARRRGRRRRRDDGVHALRAYRAVAARAGGDRRRDRSHEVLGRDPTREGNHAHRDRGARGCRLARLAAREGGPG